MRRTDSKESNCSSLSSTTAGGMSTHGGAMGHEIALQNQSGGQQNLHDQVRQSTVGPSVSPAKTCPTQLLTTIIWASEYSLISSLSRCSRSGSAAPTAPRATTRASPPSSSPGTTPRRSRTSTQIWGPATAAVAATPSSRGPPAVESAPSGNRITRRMFANIIHFMSFGDVSGLSHKIDIHVIVGCLSLFDNDFYAYPQITNVKSECNGAGSSDRPRTRRRTRRRSRGESRGLSRRRALQHPSWASEEAADGGATFNAVLASCHNEDTCVLICYISSLIISDIF